MLLDVKIQQVYLLNYLPHDFRVEKIRTCNCFLDLDCLLLEELKRVRGVDEIKDFIINYLMKSPMKEKMIALISKISIVFCLDALYLFGYMNLDSNDELHNGCRTDLPFARVKNCVFYLEDDIKSTDYNSLYFNCKFNFLNSVPVRFYKITQDAIGL